MSAGGGHVAVVMAMDTVITTVVATVVTIIVTTIVTAVNTWVLLIDEGWDVLGDVIAGFLIGWKFFELLSTKTLGLLATFIPVHR